MRILVTRPLGDARRTAARLAALGHTAVVAPLSVVLELPVDLPNEPFDAVVFTSGNAVRATADIVAMPRRLPVYAVGARTAEAARRAGFIDVRTANGDAGEVVGAVHAALPRHVCVLYLAGVDRKPMLELGLEAVGVRVLVREVYAAVPVEALPPAVADGLRAETIEAAVHYSRRSAAIFCHLVACAGLEGPLRKLAHHCISLDCAKILRKAGARTIVIAANPNEAALLGSLSSPKTKLPEP